MSTPKYEFTSFTRQLNDCLQKDFPGVKIRFAAYNNNGIWQFCFTHALSLKQTKPSETLTVDKINQGTLSRTILTLQHCDSWALSIMAWLRKLTNKKTITSDQFRNDFLDWGKKQHLY